MKKQLLTAVCICCVLFASGTLALEPGKPEDAGFIPGRLDRVDQAVMDSIGNGEIAGAVALVARNGNIIYHKSFGYADIDSKTAMHTDSIFRIASMTKAVTSVGVMMLYEQGHFRLSDPVSRFIPEFSNPAVIETNDAGEISGTRPAKREILIVDLLAHSSGHRLLLYSGPASQRLHRGGNNRHRDDR